MDVLLHSRKNGSPNAHTFDPSVGARSKIEPFSECGHVAYQIKGNEDLNNIQADISTLNVPLTSWIGLNGHPLKMYYSKCSKISN